MAKQTVNLGTMADNKSGDPLRTAFTKINENFTELYNRPTGGVTSYDDLTDKPTIPTDINQLTDEDGLLSEQPAPLFVVANVDGNIAYSNDGEDWTLGPRLTVGGQNIGVERVSVADDYIVYISGGEGGANLLYAASHLDSTPTVIDSFPSNLGEVVGQYYWEDVQYGGGYTVAVGYFQPQGESYPVPAWAYTSNGTSWTLGSIDSGYQTMYAVNAKFESVEYNGTGWMIVASNQANGEDNGGGAFYITNLSSTLSEANYVVPYSGDGSVDVNWNVDSVVWTGNRWWLRDSGADDTDSVGYIVSAGANPLDTTWQLVNVANPSKSAGFGNNVDYWEDAGGTINGVHWFVAANGAGHVIASSDGGQTFVTSIPLRFTDTVTSITTAAESIISFGDEGIDNVGERIVISNAVPSSYNGTYYIAEKGLLNGVWTNSITNTNWVEGTYSNISIAMGVEVELTINSLGQLQSNTVTNNGGVLFSRNDTFTVLGSVLGGTDGVDDMTLYVDVLDNQNNYLYTDSDLEVPFDTSELDPFVSANVLFSHGRFIDSLGFGLGKFIAGNDDEQLFVSTNLQTWTKVNDQNNSFEFWDDISFNPAYLAGGVTAETGNITFDGVEIRGIATEQKNGLIKLVPAVSIDNHNFLDNGQFVQIYPTNQYDAPHIHITAGVGSVTEGDLFLGDDNKYVQVNHLGEVSIQSYDAEGNLTFNWTFGTDGTLTMAGAVVGDVTANAYTDTTIELDVNATINKITPVANYAQHYHLADGVEGQIMYITLASAGEVNNEYTILEFDHARYHNNAGYITEASAVGGWMPFRGTGTTLTLLFIDGHWNLPHSNFD